MVYATWNNSRNDAWRCEQLYVVVRITLRTIVRNNFVVRRKGNSWVNFEKVILLRNQS